MLSDIIFAGATLEFSEDVSEYPASESCTLKYTLINSTSKINLVSTANGTTHNFKILPAATSTYTAGKYSYQKYIADNEDIILMGEGSVTVSPLFSTKTTYDNRSHAEIMVEAIQAVLEKRADNVQSSMTYKNRALQYTSYPELISALNYYKQLVEQENNKKLIEAGGTIPRIYIGLE